MAKSSGSYSAPATHDDVTKKPAGRRLLPSLGAYPPRASNDATLACAAQDVDPQAWLADVLTRINDHNIQKLDAAAALELEDRCRQARAGYLCDDLNNYPMSHIPLAHAEKSGLDAIWTAITQTIFSLSSLEEKLPIRIVLEKKKTAKMKAPGP